MECIYCGTSEDLSESDIIPDALTNARIINRNVCRVAHNNRFSDLFESKVISDLGFITNELDIKSSKGKKYASYAATIKIDGIGYDSSAEQFETHDGYITFTIELEAGSHTIGKKDSQVIFYMSLE